MSLVYYLPGHGGRLSAGLGEGLMSRGHEVAGRETVGAFRALRFGDQVDAVAGDLQEHFWREDARVVAVSFGAYLFLHALAQLPPYVGRVLLLSPIVGEFSNEQSGMSFSPPRPHKLRELAEAGEFARPAHCHIHVGSEDWQSRPDAVSAFARMLGLDVTIVPGAGHVLGKDYVGPVLDAWLAG